MPLEALRRGISPTDPILLKKLRQLRLDKQARDEQAKLPSWKQKGIGLFDKVGEFLSGLSGFGPDVGDMSPESTNASFTSKLGALLGQSGGSGVEALGAALPLAIPRKFHRALMAELDRRKHLRLTSERGFSPEFDNVVHEWTTGMGMANRNANLALTQKFRNLPEDRELLQQILKEQLETDMIPVFRGTPNNEVEQLKNFYQTGEDPGGRSFSMDPKVGHIFADANLRWHPEGAETIMDLSTTHPAIRGRRMEHGQLYRGEFPVENVLGFGDIPGQRELIFDLLGINPETNLKPLRTNIEEWYRRWR